jgi:Tfp pilus assembly protein PilF
VSYRDNAAPADVRLAQLDEAVKKNGNDHESRAQLAMLQLDTGDLDRAQKNFRVLLLHALSGTSISRADCFYKLAVIADKQGERDKAIKMARSALDLDAEHAGAQTLISLLSNPR